MPADSPLPDAMALTPMGARWRQRGSGAGFTAAALALCVAAPLLAVLIAAVQAPTADGWAGLWQAPHLGPSVGLTVWTGLAATALSWLLAAGLLCGLYPGREWPWLVARLPALLAVPHAAFAMGLVFLLAPSGWLMRLVSPWLTGMHAPPPWPTTQDPWGLGLVLALVGKEVPFLLWCAAAYLARDDVAERLPRELMVARSLGHGPLAAWWLVVWPQLWRGMGAPTLAVLAYSLTVVDMAALIGPGNPPTLAVQAWQWLADGDVTTHAQGAAAAWLLAAVVAWAALLGLALRGPVARIGFWPLWRGNPGVQGISTPQHGSPPAERRPPAAWHSGHLGHPWHGGRLGRAAAWGLVGGYALLMAVLALSSIAGVWPFPQLWPTHWSVSGWQAVWDSRGTVWLTLALALGTGVTAVVWSLAWLECAPTAWQARLWPLLALPLVMPSVLWTLGLHRVVLALGWDGASPGLPGVLGLWLAHSLAALPYGLIALLPAYQAFDARYAYVTASLGHGRWFFLWRIKWPMLRVALAASCAVGVAVSVAQFLPTLFVGAGRYETVTTQAVTMASGGQRSVAAAYAALQGLIPALGFALAAWWGRARRFRG